MPKGELHKISFCIFIFCLAVSILKSQSQPQTDEATVVDSFLAEARPNAPEILIGFNIRDREEPASCLVDIKGESTQLSEILIGWRAERMIKNVVEVRTNLEPCRLAEIEKLADTEVHSPHAWSSENVAPRDSGVVEGISTNGRGSKRRWVEELITLLQVLGGARDYQGPEGGAVGRAKASNRVDELTGNVPREDRITVAAVHAGA